MNELEEEILVDKKREPKIDADLSPRNPHNVEVARELRWRYDKQKRVYRDRDGHLIADKFGQPLG